MRPQYDKSLLFAYLVKTATMPQTADLGVIIALVVFNLASLLLPLFKKTDREDLLKEKADLIKIVEVSNKNIASIKDDITKISAGLVRRG